MRADGRAPDQLRPITFDRDFTHMAAGLVPRVVRRHPGAVHGVDRRGRPPLDAPPRHRLGHRRVLDAARGVARAHPPRGQGRQAVGPHAGDPAAHRPRAAHRLRHEGAGRAAGGRRLRRPPGRRRHPHGLDLRRATSPSTTPSPASSARARCKAHPLAAGCAAISVGVVDGNPVLDLPYVEDSSADVDMNVVMTSEGRFIEVQGTAEGLAFGRDRARRHARAWPRRGSPRSWTCRPTCWRRRRRRGVPWPRSVTPVLFATGNPHKLAEVRSILGPLGDRRRRGPRRRGDRHDVRGERPAQGACGRRPHRLGGGGGGLRHRGRRAGRRARRLFGAVDRGVRLDPPGAARAGGRRCRRPRPFVPLRGGGGGRVARRAARSSCGGSSRGRWPTRPGGPAGSGTTRSWCRWRATGGRSRRCRRREGSVESSGAGVSAGAALLCCRTFAFRSTAGGSCRLRCRPTAAGAYAPTAVGILGATRRLVGPVGSLTWGVGVGGWCVSASLERSS